LLFFGLRSETKDFSGLDSGLFHGLVVKLGKGDAVTGGHGLSELFRDLPCVLTP
jgi:hypothetical protein